MCRPVRLATLSVSINSHPKKHTVPLLVGYNLGFQPVGEDMTLPPQTGHVDYSNRMMIA